MRPERAIIVKFGPRMCLPTAPQKRAATPRSKRHEHASHETASREGSDCAPGRTVRYSENGPNTFWETTT
jgi:hypothetical protein